MEGAPKGEHSLRELFDRHYLNTKNKETKKTIESKEKNEKEKSPSQMVKMFEAGGLPFNYYFAEMLNEEKSYQTNRRGCGFTHVNRQLARIINKERKEAYDDITAIFDDSVYNNIEEELYCKLKDWDLVDKVDIRTVFPIEKIKNIQDSVEGETSKIFIQMIMDVLKPRNTDSGIPEIKIQDELLKVGSCTTAELYFYEYLKPGYRHPNSDSKINVVVDDSGVPVLVEKIGLGNDHSAISLKSIQMNGVEVPSGSLVAIKYPDNTSGGETKSKNGNVIEFKNLEAAEFLRLTPLVTDPESRNIVWNNHLDMQVKNDFYKPESIKLEDFISKASDEIS
jgi:hypothetical protein